MTNNEQIENINTFEDILDEEVEVLDFEILVNPTKLSELDDDIGLAENQAEVQSQINDLQQQINNFLSDEDTEMSDIIELLERRNDNFINFDEE